MTGNLNKNLVVITESYPLGAVAESFLDLELPYLSKVFDTVVIVPRVFPAELERIERELPSNVSVNRSLLDLKLQNIPLKSINYLFTVGKTTNIYKEIFKNPHILIDIASLKKAIGYLYEALQIQNWVLHYIEQKNPDLTKTIFYTYWMDYATLGIGLAKEKNSMIKLVSRAHRGDIYDYAIKPPYLPFRSEITRTDRIYFISNHGETYITSQYPALTSKSMVSRLGVIDPGFLCKSSSDGIFRIVSCSYIVPVKRIHLILLALKELGLRRPDIQIEWTHIGYGALQKQMEECARSHLPKNVISRFLGYLTVSPVSDYYVNHSIDVFINVSASEGIPVSIMEAQSCGIPVIATAVGGTPEIVSEKVGILISENPSPSEIGDALEFFFDHPDIIRQMKQKSIENWCSNYNAMKNFTEFANSLKMI
jgi:colanic acid/amylovoran biosynthesis glycosyltransferase